MTQQEFRDLLANNRGEACRLLAEWKVREWLNDGTPEIVRCLGLWMEERQNLGDDEFLVDRAYSCMLIDTDPPGDYGAGRTP